MRKSNNFVFLIWGIFFVIIGFLAENLIFVFTGGISSALFVFYTLSDHKKEQRNKLESAETKQTENQSEQVEPIKSKPFEIKREEGPKSTLKPCDDIKQPVVKRRTAFEYSYDELPKMNFSELRKDCDSEDLFLIPELSEEEIDQLKKMSRTFWAGDSRILQESRGDLEEDRYVGMLRIYEYIRSWCGYGYSFFTNTEVEKSLLKYRYDSWSGTCYDGGCYSDDSGEAYIYVARIPSDELEIEFRKKWNTYHSDIPKRLGFQGNLPGTDCMAFYTRSELWLKQPFGLTDGFYIYTKNY